MLQRNLEPLSFRYDKGLLTEAPVCQDLVDKALAHVNWALRSYQEASYTAAMPPAIAAKITAKITATPVHSTPEQATCRRLAGSGLDHAV